MAKADGQRLVQAWFPGVHRDSGGGEAARGLSDAALVWMVEEAKRAGLAFIEGRDAPLGVTPDARAPMNRLMTLFYRVFGQIDRCIDDPAYLARAQAAGRENNPPRTIVGTAESLSATACQRRAAVADYRSKPLANYLERFPAAC